MAWLGMAITAIIGYNCNIDFEGTGANYGSLLITTLYHMYFRGKILIKIVKLNSCGKINCKHLGDCPNINFPPIEFQPIEELDLVPPSTINIWMWVVVSLSFIWLLSSLTLLMSMRKITIFHLNILILNLILKTLKSRT